MKGIEIWWDILEDDRIPLGEVAATREREAGVYGSAGRRVWVVSLRRHGILRHVWRRGTRSGELFELFGSKFMVFVNIEGRMLLRLCRWSSANGAREVVLGFGNETAAHRVDGVMVRSRRWTSHHVRISHW